MADTKKTNTEGGTDFDGLQDFIVSVDTTGYEEQEPEVELDLGEGNNPEPEKKEEPEAPSEEKKEEPEKPEAPKEEVKEKEEDSPEVNQSNSYYAKMAQKYLTKGKWQDAEIETENGTVKLSELDNIDEETFFAIEEQQDKFSSEEIKNNYIKKGDFDESKLKIIEILKEGGDIKEIFATPEEAQRPFEGVDLEDEGIQKNVFFNYLTKVQSLNPEDAKVVLKNHASRGELDSKVKEIVKGYQDNYDKQLADKLEAIKAEKAEKQLKDKEFSKRLQEVYKGFDLDEKLVKKFSTLATKRTDDGDFELDSVYATKMEDPKEAADLIFFLTDKEGFLKSKMAETKINTEKSNLKKINLLKDKQRKDDKSSKDTVDSNNPFVIDVNNM